MSDQPRDLNFYNSSMYDHKTNSPKSYDHHPSYMSFHDTLETAFIGLSPSSSEVFSDPCNLTSQNSSVSSSSAETGIEEDSTKSSKREKQEMKELEENGGEKESPKKKVLGANKGTKTKGETKKRERGQRFAFMTKSDVDQLEDGYRWRKYGQKAVKNSPYPRSYYRCTFQKCTVKKRVERSYEDPSIVITTYEGQHNHQIPTTLRGSAASAAALFSPFSSSSSMLTSSPTPPPPPAFLRQQQHSSFFPQNQQLLIQMMHPPPPPPPPPPPSHPMNHNTNNNSYVGTTTNNTFFQLPDDYGLLQDMVPSFVHHNT